MKKTCTTKVDPVTNLFPWETVFFAQMIHNAVSQKEREFFEIMKYRQGFKDGITVDCLIDDTDNPDGIYLTRLMRNEFEVGKRFADGHYAEEEHVMNIKEVLPINLLQHGYIERDLTLLDWLRETDYQYVHYDRMEE